MLITVAAEMEALERQLDVAREEAARYKKAARLWRTRFEQEKRARCVCVVCVWCVCVRVCGVCVHTCMCVMTTAIQQGVELGIMLPRRHQQILTVSWPKEALREVEVQLSDL